MMKKGFIVIAVILVLCMGAVPVLAEEMQLDEDVSGSTEVTTETLVEDTIQDNIDALAIWLSNGQTSEDVSSIQQMLNSLGYNAGPVDGYYGDVTDNAVRRFQTDHGLYVDGIVGDITMGILRSQVQGEPEAAVEEQTSEPAEDVSLVYGIVGSPDVTWLQNQLNQLGYNAGIADGYFGNMTEAAVKQYQADHGLYVDGVVGPLTLRVLRSRVENAEDHSNTSSNTAADENTEENTEESTEESTEENIEGDLVYGMRGSSAVTWLQNQLNKLGYNAGTADGYFGSMTQAAVRRYQEDHGLYVDGVVGSQTKKSLRGSTGNTSTSTNTNTATATDIDLRVGMTGNEVRDLQKKLAELGYPVTVDGVYGAQTAQIVKEFQKLNGLYVDGVFGNISAAALNGNPVAYGAGETENETEDENEDASEEGSEDSYLITEDVVEHVRGIVAQATTENMSPNEKLRAVFDYIGNRSVYPYQQNRVPYYTGMDWPLVYAEDMINLGGSDCHGTAALFGYAANMLGYDNVHWISNGYHGWVDIDGLIYDPVFTNSSYHTTVYGYTYAEGQAVGLGAGFENMEGYDGTYRYVRVPRIR